MKLAKSLSKSRVVAREEAPLPNDTYIALKACAGNVPMTAELLGKSQKIVEQVIAQWGYDKRVESELLDELEAKVLQASLGLLRDPNFNPATAISVLAKRRPEKWSGRKNAAKEETSAPPPRVSQSNRTPAWKKRANALRVKYAAVEPTIREPDRADGSVLSEDPGREIIEPDVKGGIREPD